MLSDGVEVGSPKVRYRHVIEGSEKTSSSESTRTSDHADPHTPPIPIVKLADRLIESGSQYRASDIHIEPFSDSLRVRFRIDGSLVDADNLPLGYHGPLVSRLKIMGGMNIVERRRPQDGQFSTICNGRSLDVRLATLSTIHGEKIVLRLLDQRRTTRGLGELGMAPSAIEIWRGLIRSPFGLVLCCGPTGSGKTTTLYASLTDMEIGDRNVTTIEDPVEYVIAGINQVRTNDQAGLTFAAGLRALLRQDPDVILIGELRDQETARLGVQAALTGHFVLSSIHANDAAGALQRLIDMGVEPFLVSSSLTGVIGQRLVRRVCTACSHAYLPNPDELELFRRYLPGARTEFRRGTGCSACSHTGYLDRVGVYEILRITPQIRRHLMHRADAQTIRATALDEGMISLRIAAMQLVESGVTTIDEVVRSLGAHSTPTDRVTAS
jgi:type IV pilus assembly protein PilB